MKYVTIKNALGEELERHEITESIPQDIIEPAALITCEVWNRDHPGDGWEVVIIDDEE